MRPSMLLFEGVPPQDCQEAARFLASADNFQNLSEDEKNQKRNEWGKLAAEITDTVMRMAGFEALVPDDALKARGMMAAYNVPDSMDQVGPVIRAVTSLISCLEPVMGTYAALESIMRGLPILRGQVRGLDSDDPARQAGVLSLGAFEKAEAEAEVKTAIPRLLDPNMPQN